MKKIFLLCALFSLSACGVESLTAAATSAVLKKEEAQIRKQQHDRLKESIEKIQEQQRAKDRAAREAFGMLDKSEEE